MFKQFVKILLISVGLIGCYFLTPAENRARLQSLHSNDQYKERVL